MQRAAVDRPPARGLVGGDELVDRPEAADLERFTEAPCLEAEPGEVLERVADVHELPVDDRVQAGGSDDDVADAEVAVDEGVGGRRRAVRHQPGVRLVEGRAAVVERAVLVPDAEGIGRLGAGQLCGVDGVEAGEEAAEVADEHAACLRERLVPEDAAGDRLARHAPHDEAGRAEESTVVVGEDFRHAQSGATTCAHRVRFAAHDAGCTGSTGRVPPQDELLAVGGERPRLARRRRSGGAARRSRPARPARVRPRWRAGQCPAAIPTGRSSTTWSRYSESPAPRGRRRTSASCLRSGGLPGPRVGCAAGCSTRRRPAARRRGHRSSRRRCCESGTLRRRTRT